MKTNQEAKSVPDMRRLNTVTSVFSQDDITHLEYIIHSAWDDFSVYSFINNMMKLLEVYVKHEPDDAPSCQKADRMTRFVCGLFNLREQLGEMERSAKPWVWVETMYGYSLPPLEVPE